MVFVTGAEWQILDTTMIESTETHIEIGARPFFMDFELILDANRIGMPSHNLINERGIDLNGIVLSYST